MHTQETLVRDPPDCRPDRRPWRLRMTANAFLHRTLPRLWQQRGLVARALWPLSQL